MIVAIGIDIIEVCRIEEVFARRGERFRDRVFTPDEIAYCEKRGSRFLSYAARFAAKEAVMKGLGTGWGSGVAWRDIEIVLSDAGAPAIHLRGRALERLLEIGARRVHLSLSHTRHLAMAEVVLES